MSSIYDNASPAVSHVVEYDERRARGVVLLEDSDGTYSERPIHAGPCPRPCRRIPTIDEQYAEDAAAWRAEMIRMHGHSACQPNAATLAAEEARRGQQRRIAETYKNRR